MAIQSYQVPNNVPNNALYPPPQDPNTYGTLNSTTTLATSTVEAKLGEDARQISRTPSPTPSELKELQTGAIDWKTLRTRKFWFRREWLWYYVILVVILVMTALITLYHKQIVDWLTPATRWLHDLKVGWLVPIGILFVISFPPLFGHEIVAILCGLVWGLWVGFAIVAAGTFLGEVGNFYAFKYCCRSRGEKLEKTKITYACLARVVRDGGFKIALIARLSAIPGHFTTAVFSTCGMGIFVFSIAAILSMPKQFITVYLGVILEQSNSGVKDTKSRIISDVVLAITFVITAVAMWYIFRQMNKVKPQVIYDRRKARQVKLSRAGFSPYHSSNPSESSTDVFNPNDSDSAIPLTSTFGPGDTRHQQWDSHGKAVGFAPDPTLNGNAIHAPRARADTASALLPRLYPRDEEEAGGAMGIGYGYLKEDSVDVVGWDTANAPPTREFAQVIVAQPPRLAPSQEQTAHSSNQSQSTFVFQQQQTPRQADFVGMNTSMQASSSAIRTPRSPFNEAFGLDDDPAPVYGHGHAQEPTDATFRTAFTSSPDQHQELRFQNPHDNTGVGRAASPPPRQAQTKSPIHTPQLR